MLTRKDLVASVEGVTVERLTYWIEMGFVVPEQGEGEQKFADIDRACKIALGENVAVQFEYVDSLPTTPTGKHRYVVSELA